MKIYLLEVYSPDIKFDADSLIIALTPLACYQMDRAGIEYSIIEDYYDEIELTAREDDYHKIQLQWIQRLDSFLQETIKEVKELDLKLGTIYYYYLKTAVLDPVYLRSYTLRKLFEAVKPSAVTFVSLPTSEASFNYTLFNSGRSYNSQVAEALCLKNDIPLETIVLESEVLKSTGAVDRRESIAARLKLALSRNSLARRVYFFYKYCKNRANAGEAGNTKKKLTIFLLKIGHTGVDFVIEALKKGHTVFQLTDGSIEKYSRFGAQKKYNLEAEKDRLKTPDDSVWKNAASQLESHKLVGQLNEMSQADVSRIVLPGLKHFVSRLCPEIFSYFNVFRGLFEKEKVDFVITPHEVLPAEFAAIAAGRRHDSKSIDLEHGDSVFAPNFWDIIFLSHFDINISSNRETREYFKHRCRVNGFSTKTYHSPHRLLPVQRTRKLRETGNEIIRNRIVFLPTIFLGDRSRYDCVHYPDTWYYKFQKALIEYFSTRKEYTFVWKSLPTSDAVYNPIPNFIKDKSYENIEIATSPFTQHLLTVDKVICDYPSTGFYESVIAGVPTLSLYNRALKVRQSALELFGNLLAPFSDIREAIGHIEKFLQSDPELYKTTFDLEGKKLLDLLEEISRGEAD